MCVGGGGGRGKEKMLVSNQDLFPTFQETDPIILGPSNLSYPNAFNMDKSKALLLHGKKENRRTWTTDRQVDLTKAVCKLVDQWKIEEKPSNLILKSDSDSNLTNQVIKSELFWSIIRRP